MTTRTKRNPTNADEILDSAQDDEPESQTSEVKERIYTAALELFSRKGYDAVSVREICLQAQTTAPMLYYYFRHKKGLYRYILTEAARIRRRGLERALKMPGDPPTRLRNILEAWAGLNDEPTPHQTRLFYLREVFGMGSESFKSSVENWDRQMRHALKSILQDGIDEGIFRPMRVEMAVLAIIGIVNTFIRRLALGAPLQMEDGIEQVMDTFLYGLLARDDSAAPPRHLVGSTSPSD